MNPQSSTTLHLDPAKEQLVSHISSTSEFIGRLRTKNNEGVYIEGMFVGELDVGGGTVAIGKSGQFVGSLRAGKLISDGRITRNPDGADYSSSDGKLQLDITGAVVLGPNSLTEIDCNYVDIEVQRGARLKARFEAVDAPAASAQTPAPAPIDTPAPRASLVAVTSAASRPAGEGSGGHGANSINSELNGTTGAAFGVGQGYGNSSVAQG